MAFFDPVNQAIQRNKLPEPAVAVSLIADFDAVLVRSLATPDTPCATMAQATDQVSLQSGLKADSISSPAICAVMPMASIRVMPKRTASQPPPRLATIPASS